MDQRTKKVLVMKKNLQPRDGIEWLYMSREEKGRGLAIIEDNVDTSIEGHENRIKKSKVTQITATNNSTVGYHPPFSTQWTSRSAIYSSSY